MDSLAVLEEDMFLVYSYFARVRWVYWRKQTAEMLDFVCGQGRLCMDVENDETIGLVSVLVRKEKMSRETKMLEHLFNKDMHATYLMSGEEAADKRMRRILSM